MPETHAPDMRLCGMKRLILTTFLGTLLCACTGAEDPVVIQANTNAKVLDADARFETLYVGNWSTSGVCSGDEVKWEIEEDVIRAGDRSCMITGIEDEPSLLKADLTDCWAEGEPVPDRSIQLDVAGQDILYLTTSDNRRLRLERCGANGL